MPARRRASAAAAATPAAAAVIAGRGAESRSKYRGAQGLDPKFIAELEKQFGFDKPAPERFL